jgi:hypothetical protein
MGFPALEFICPNSTGSERESAASGVASERANALPIRPFLKDGATLAQSSYRLRIRALPEHS